MKKVSKKNLMFRVMTLIVITFFIQINLALAIQKIPTATTTPTDNIAVPAVQNTPNNAPTNIVINKLPDNKIVSNDLFIPIVATVVVLTSGSIVALVLRRKKKSPQEN
jgi:hypothetical protein